MLYLIFSTSCKFERLLRVKVLDLMYQADKPFLEHTFDMALIFDKCQDFFCNIFLIFDSCLKKDSFLFPLLLFHNENNISLYHESEANTKIPSKDYL